MTGSALTSAQRLQRLLATLSGAHPVLLSGPVRPDGDSLGACLALQRVVRQAGLRCEVAGDVPARYRWLPGAQGIIPDHQVQPNYPAVVVLDGDRHRLTPPVARAWQRASLRTIVDHHASTDAKGYHLPWIDPNSPSTCQMLYQGLGEAGADIDPDLATLLYVGTLFDTGGFRYSNTTPATHEMAAHLLRAGADHHQACVKVLMERGVHALKAAAQIFASAHLTDNHYMIGRVPLALSHQFGLQSGDLEGVVDALVYLVDVQVAALLIERPDGYIKLSLRSRGPIDVRQVARILAPSGGGHPVAAGVSLPGPLAAAETALLGVLRSLSPQAARSDT